MDKFSESIMNPHLQQHSIQSHRVRPTNAFIKFEKSEIERSIPERFEQQVAKYPDRIAIKTRNHALTYDALNKAANRLARAVLAQCAEGTGQIALLLENDAPMIAAILGVLKAGKTYVPLDPTLPRARTAYILKDSQARLIMTNSASLSLAKELTQDTLQLTNTDELDSSLPTDNLGLSISPDTLTWILYTSGSTGQPKGVVQNHRNVLHFIMNYTNGLHICPDDRLTFLYSFSVNGAAHDIFSALLNGASLYPVNVKEEGLARVADWLIEQEITIYCTVPTVFRHFCGTLNGEERFPNIRLIKLIGEPVYRREVELYRTHFSQDCILVDRLGSTETGTVRWYFIDTKTQIDGNMVPVGYPVEDNEVILLDDAREGVGFNEIGEIAVRSRYLSPGYWRKPDRTAAVFLPDPEGGSERIYLTGDFGQMQPDGCLMCLGRKDFQIKIRGYRIEVAEIEMALLGHSAIKEAVVVAREDVLGDQRLVAYLVPFRSPGPTVTALRRLLAERLPDYMIPSIFVTLDALPLAPNGKVDRRALPEPILTRPGLENPFAAPRNEVEAQLTRIWEEVLGIQSIGVEDSFFELGGQSLLAARVVSHIRREFGVGLSLRRFLNAPTVAALAAEMERVQVTGEDGEDRATAESDLARALRLLERF